MYNCFVAQSNQNKNKKKNHQQEAIDRYNRKYKSSFQPQLIHRYNRRINGFAKKMEGQPKHIQDYQGTIPSHKLFREEKNQLNMSTAQFRFKNSDDWKSLFTASERMERKQQQRLSQKKGYQDFALRSIGSQSQYTNKPEEHRERDRSKDINPPMKYTNKTSLLTLVSLPNLKKKKIKSIIEKQNLTRERSKTNHSHTSIDSDGRDSQKNVSDYDMLSLYSQLMRKTGRDRMKTQKQIEEEQQLKALAHNKLYFKSLLNLQMKAGKKDQKALKDTLRKCGVIKSLHKNIEQKSEDNFQTLLNDHSKTARN